MPGILIQNLSERPIHIARNPQLNEIDVVSPEHPLPKLPMARAVWIPRPNLKVAASAWIYAGGAHHTSFSQALTAENLRDFAEIADIEFVRIGKDTRLDEYKNELKWNKAYYVLRSGLPDISPGAKNEIVDAVLHLQAVSAATVCADQNLE